MNSNGTLLMICTGILLIGMYCHKSIPATEPPLLILPITFTANPANNWRVGYTLTDSLNLAQLQLSTETDTTALIPMWHAGLQNYYPYLAQNPDSVTRLHESGRWALRPHEIAMEASAGGQLSVLQYVVPRKGRYKVKAIFEGIHFGLSSTDVHVLLNNDRLFFDSIEGYGGDPAFHEITGAHPAAIYEAVLDLNANDILSFAVGYGANKTHYNDTTGLLFFLVEV